jgi:hypothetical protein
MGQQALQVSGEGRPTICCTHQATYVLASSSGLMYAMFTLPGVLPHQTMKTEGRRRVRVEREAPHADTKAPCGRGWAHLGSSIT